MINGTEVLTPALKDALLKQQDYQLERVSVPPWGVDVFIRPMTAKERFDMDMLNRIGAGDFLPLLAACIVYEDGSPIFSKEELENRSASVIEQHLLDPILRINRLRNEDVIDAEKN